MQNINHNHLFYFWRVAKHQNVTKAARELGLAQPTVSAQIRSLEAQIRTALLTRRGRHIELTEAGQIVYRHADEMFRIAAELPDALAGRMSGEMRPMHVGTCDYVPRPIIRRILSPLMEGDNGVRVVCREWRIDELLAELGLFHLDLVLADRPHPDSSKVQAISKPLLETPIAIYAKPQMARKLRQDFPQSLHQSPMLLPVKQTRLREQLDQWFAENDLAPKVIGEFDDRGLLKTFGHSGLGALPGAHLIEEEIRQQYGLERVGWVRGVREIYYAIAVQRQAMHPAVQKLLGLKKPVLGG